MIRERMLRTKRRDTKPELLLRSALHRAGFRFRVDVSPIKGVRARADLVFSGPRVAVFVNGCFWHGCPLHATWPKNNAQWWKEKIEGNRQRDQRVDRLLIAEGWVPLRIWEHEPVDDGTARVVEAVRLRTPSAVAGT